MIRKRMIVGVSGATGVVYAVRLLEILREMRIETHLIVTPSGNMTRAYETEISAPCLQELADVVYNCRDVGAAISSGSFRTIGMIVAPCSVRSMSEIAHGVTSNLLTRAADVCLKERRRLVLMLRETPLHSGHIRSMLAASEAGAIIAPPVPAFYAKPQSLEEMVNHTVCRVLDLFDIEVAGVVRWGEPVMPTVPGNQPSVRRKDEHSESERVSASIT